MPVVSPSRYTTTSNSLSGSYRSTLSSASSLDKPYYRTGGTYVTSSFRSTIGDRTTEYRSRYSDVDGKRERKSSLVEYTRSSRAPSVTDSDSGISTRYRSERSESRSRDISTTRSESSKAEPLRNGRKERPLLSATSLAMSTAELYNKYSPANYIPLTQRIQQQASQNSIGEIARSKSISSDIGRPPAADSSRARKPRNSVAATIVERARYKDPPSQKRNARDTNGNDVPSVSDLRKRFDQKMTVTKLPTNEPKYGTKSVEQFLSQLKECEANTGYTKVVQDDKPVPIHLPYEKNGVKYDSKSSSSSDLTKTIDAKLDKVKDRLASIKSQLDPNNPIGKILEKSTVIQAENGDYNPGVKNVINGVDKTKYGINDDKTRVNGIDKAKYGNDIDKPEVNGIDKVKYGNDIDKTGVNGIDKAKYGINDNKTGINGIDKAKYGINDDKTAVNGIDKAPHTSNNASYIQITPPEETKRIKYIDDEDRLLLENDIDSPGTGFENKTFEHENYLKKRTEHREAENQDEGNKSMETSTESTMSEEESSPETSAVKRRVLDEKDIEDIKEELAGGKSGAVASRRSSERSDASDARVERKPSQTSGLNGLRNIGNTCFMNSVLQCLSNTRPLLEYVSDDKYTSDINTTLSCMKGALIKAFASVIKELWRSGERDSVVNTTTFKSSVQRFAPRFMGYSQQDAQEFLRYLLEGLHEDVNRVTVKPKPILTEIDDNLSDSAKAAEAWSRYLRMEDSRVGDIFVGQLKSTLRCTHCNHDSVTFDPFWDLSLPIPSRTGNMKLQQCLAHFTKEEEMDGDEKPTCSKCGVRRKCLKWFTVHKFPQVLVLHLKRFSPTERFRGKLNVLVEFPLNGLDMSPYAASRGQQPVYNLYAVSNHSGTTYSGHYTAYCKHPYTGDWHEYNDSRVSSISPRNVVSSEAYVLFYELARSSNT